MNPVRNTFQITFFLRTDKMRKDGGCPLYLRITLRGTQCTMGMHFNLHKTQWNSRLQKVVKNPLARLYNQELENTRIRLLHIYHESIETSSILNATTIKEKYITPSTHQQAMLLAISKIHNDEMTALIGSKYSKGTYKNYKTTHKTLTRFVNDVYKLSDYPLKSVDYSFISRLDQYVRKHGCTNNGAMKHLQRLRKILNYAIKNEWLDQNPFRHYTISFRRFVRGYLDIQELRQMEQAKLDSPTLEKVRHWFLFSCYTGLPYADLKTLCWENIRYGVDENLWIDLRRKKTDTSILLPLIPKAQHLLPKKGKGLVFSLYSNQKVNLYLKKIALTANIHKNVTFHLARHTFATTITLSNGIPIETVSKMLGHSNIKTTQLYSKVVELKISRDMATIFNPQDSHTLPQKE